MNWPELAERPLPWASSLNWTENGQHSVVFTRLSTYRNFSGFPFTVSAPPNICAAIADKALHLLTRQGGFTIQRLSDCPSYALRLLRERHVLPSRFVPFPGKKEFKYVAFRPQGNAWALVNEVEHLTFGQIFPGRFSELEFNSAYSVPQGESPWCELGSMGFLASYPGRIGPGLEVDILVHLPGLVLSRRLGHARNALSAFGIGFFPLGSLGGGEADAGLFLLRSRGGGGKSALQVYQDLLKNVQPIMELEASLQRQCLDKHHKRLEVRLRQSLQHLTEASVLSYPEVLAMSSYLRLGAYLALINPQILGIVEELRIKAGSGHLGVSLGHNMSKEEEDKQRGNVVRLAMEMYRS